MSMEEKKTDSRVDYNIKQKYHSDQQNKKRNITQYNHYSAISLQQSSSTKGKHQSEDEV